MKSPLIGTEPGHQICALDETPIPAHHTAHVHFDDNGNMTGVVFLDADGRLLHKCGEDFPVV